MTHINNLPNLIKSLETKTFSLNGLVDFISQRDIKFKWHPLGFLVGRLGDIDGSVIRLHIWPTSGIIKQHPEWRVHDHTYSIASWVVAGEITNTLYEKSNSGQSGVIYNVEYNSGCSLLKRSDKHLHLSKSTSNIFIAGSHYKVPSGVFHNSTSSKKSTTITIVKATNSNTRFVPRVFGELLADEEYTYIRKELPKAKVIEIIKSAN